MKPGRFNHVPQAAEEFARTIIPISGVTDDYGRIGALPCVARADQQELFVLPAESAQRMDRLLSKQELDRTGQGRLAHEGDTLIFVSHRWDHFQHPDTSGMQLKCLQSLVAWLNAVGYRDVVFWYDYCSMPQPPVSKGEENALREALERIPALLGTYALYRCPGIKTLHSHAARGWCILETALSTPTNIPGDDNVGAMLRQWLRATAPESRVRLVADWERIWVSDISEVGGFEDCRILAFIGLAANRGDPMTDKGQFARSVLSDVAAADLTHDLTSLLLRCTVPSDIDLILQLWRNRSQSSAQIT